MNEFEFEELCDCWSKENSACKLQILQMLYEIILGKYSGNRKINENITINPSL